MANQDVSQVEGAVVYGPRNQNTSQVEGAVVYGPPADSVLVSRMEVCFVFAPAVSGVKARRSVMAISA